MAKSSLLIPIFSYTDLLSYPLAASSVFSTAVELSCRIDDGIRKAYPVLRMLTSRDVCGDKVIKALATTRAEMTAKITKIFMFSWANCGYLSRDFSMFSLMTRLQSSDVFLRFLLLSVSECLVVPPFEMDTDEKGRTSSKQI